MQRLEAGDPRAVGPYRTLARIGTGGMAAVYLARSRGGRSVAVKVMHADFAREPSYRDGFRREIAAGFAAGGVHSPSVLAADPDAATPWMATEFLPSLSLRDAVERFGPLPAGTVRRLAAGLAEALADFHRAGIVHLDVTPANVLLTAEGPRLIDFGIATGVPWAAGPQDGSSAQGSGHAGSWGFMSPEQVAGTAGPPSDIYSLGATLEYAYGAADPPSAPGPPAGTAGASGSPDGASGAGGVADGGPGVGGSPDGASGSGDVADGGPGSGDTPDGGPGAGGAADGGPGAGGVNRGPTAGHIEDRGSSDSVPSGSAPSDSAPSGSVPPGAASSDFVPPGSVSSGSAWSDSAVSGSAVSGSVPFGSGVPGAAPAGRVAGDPVLRALVADCRRPEAAARPTAAELVQRLAPGREESGAPAADWLPPQVVAAIDETASAADNPPAPASPHPGRRRLLLGGVATAVVAAAGGTAAVLATRSDGSPSGTAAHADPPSGTASGRTGTPGSAPTSASGAPAASATPSAKPVPLVFEVTGTGTLTMLAYGIDGKLVRSRKTRKLPWRKTVQVQQGAGSTDWQIMLTLASGKARCRVLLDGRTQFDQSAPAKVPFGPSYPSDIVAGGSAAVSGPPPSLDG